MAHRSGRGRTTLKCLHHRLALQAVLLSHVKQELLNMAMDRNFCQGAIRAQESVRPSSIKSISMFQRRKASMREQATSLPGILEKLDWLEVME